MATKTREQRNVNRNYKRITENSCQTFVCENFFICSVYRKSLKREALIKLVCNKCWINGKFIIMVYKCCIVGCSSNYTTEEANTVFFLFQRTRILGKDGLNLSTEKTGYQHRRLTFVKIISNTSILEKAKTISATV